MMADKFRPKAGEVGQASHLPFYALSYAGGKTEVTIADTNFDELPPFTSSYSHSCSKTMYERGVP